MPKILLTFPLCVLLAGCSDGALSKAERSEVESIVDDATDNALDGYADSSEVEDVSAQLADLEYRVAQLEERLQ